MRSIIACCSLLSGFVLLMPGQAFAEDAQTDTPPGPERPPPPPPLEPTKLPETRHVDIGVGLAFVQRVADGQTSTLRVSYPAALGMGLSARVDVWRYLRASLYAVRASTTTNFAPATLGFPGEPSELPITTYSFGLRLSPTLPLGPRARVWATIGAGWGRFEAGRFDVEQFGGDPKKLQFYYQVRERAFSFVEFPMGLGFSVDVIKNWLAVEFEATAAPHAAERGTARENGQVIIDGARRALPPFPEISVTFVETIGLALIL